MNPENQFQSRINAINSTINTESTQSSSNIEPSRKDIQKAYTEDGRLPVEKFIAEFALKNEEEKMSKLNSTGFIESENKSSNSLITFSTPNERPLSNKKRNKRSPNSSSENQLFKKSACKELDDDTLEHSSVEYDENEKMQDSVDENTEEDAVLNNSASQVSDDQKSDENKL